MITASFLLPFNISRDGFARGKNRVRERSEFYFDSFYAIASSTCFALAGLWWGVVQFNKDWLKEDETRALAVPSHKSG